MSSLSSEQFSYDPFAPEVLDNPLPYYRELRDHHPGYYVEKYDMFVFTRYQDIIDVLSQVNDNTFVATESSLPLPSTMARHNDGAPPFVPVKPMGPGPMLPSPQYEEMRLAHIAPLRPRKVKELQDFVRELVLDRLKLLLPRGKFDIMNEYGGRVSAAITCHLFGLPLAEAKEVMDAVNGVSGFNPDIAGIDTGQMFIELGNRFILPAVKRRRAAGADGSVALIDGLINHRVEEDGRALTDEEIVNQLTCVFNANTETPAKPAGQGLLALWRHPEQLAAVRENLHANVPVAVEEMLRICTTAQWMIRTAHRDTMVLGQPIKAGQRVLVSPFAAARDEREFENPEAFIWNREIPRNLAFGFGQHHCVGNHIARLQIRTLVREFLSHVSDFEFVLEEARHSSSYFHWSYTYLPVVVGKYTL